MGNGHLQRSLPATLMTACVLGNDKVAFRPGARQLKVEPASETSHCCCRCEPPSRAGAGDPKSALFKQFDGIRPSTNLLGLHQLRGLLAKPVGFLAKPPVSSAQTISLHAPLVFRPQPRHVLCLRSLGLRVHVVRVLPRVPVIVVWRGLLLQQLVLVLLKGEAASIKGNCG